MIVYKLEDRFNPKTGEPTDPISVYDKILCDFTGEELDDYSYHLEYQVNYLDHDACYGDGEGEEWLYRHWEARGKREFDTYELFGQSIYHYKTEEQTGRDCILQLIESFAKEVGPYSSLDQVMRWGRAKMIKKHLDDGTYNLEHFVER